MLVGAPVPIAVPRIPPRAATAAGRSRLEAAPPAPARRVGGDAVRGRRPCRLREDDAARGMGDERAARRAWRGCRIDEAAATPSVFWAHVAAALGVTAAEDEATLAGAIALAERSASPALVLDGYERIAGSPAEAELWRFVAERPPLQLVVAGRGEPSAPLAGARARGEVLELRAADLRLDREEALELVGGRPAGELAEACAGWPAALRLALSAPSPRCVGGTAAGPRDGGDPPPARRPCLSAAHRLARGALTICLRRPSGE